MVMDDKRLAEIEAEFCPTIGVTREPSHGVPALIAEVRRLRAIIAGRTTPPTDAEIDAHASQGGGWQVQWVVGTPTQRYVGDEFGSFHDPADARQWRSSGDIMRWISVDAEGRPCEWPSAGEGER